MPSADAPLDGVLPVDKPAGPTSHDVVGVARRALRTRRIGHTGTLDPFASGLLLLCVGPATRIAEYLTGLDKRYTAGVKLGVATDTDDCTGEIIGEADTGHLDEAAVLAALASFHGEVMQRPPSYSAKKRDGERAYAAARAGRPLELAPVPVRIHELRVVHCAPPDVVLDIRCGSGTYIRAIARDLGAALGVGGHLTSLRRTGVGEFAVDGALTLEELADPSRVNSAFVAPAAALAAFPRISLHDDQVRDVRHGRALRVGAACDTAPELVLTDGAGNLVAIGSCDAGVIRPRKVFA